MHIALTAPTGKVGTAVLTAARERNIPIRALARDATRLRVPASASVHFDFADRTTYARALTGVETLILISPSIPDQIDVDRAVVEAARAAGVRHVIRLSGAGAEHGGNRFADQHRAIDQHIEASGIAATIVRPTFFMENMLGLTAPIAAGTYPAPTADARMGQIAVADIAAVLLAIATNPAAHRGATYALTGPAAYRGDEIANALSEAAGHHVRYVDVPEDAYHESLLRVGLDAWTADGLIEAYRLVRAGGAAVVTDDVRRVTGRTPIDFTAWARTHAAAFRANASASAQEGAMSSTQREAVFVNVIEVDPIRYQELVAILQEGNDTVIRHRDGFLSALIVATPDASRVVTIARWKSPEAVKALQSDPLITEYIKRTAAVAKANPAVFTIVAEYRP